MDLQLDHTDHDLAWTDGQLGTATGVDEIQQAILIALRTGLGEWIFDLLAGVAYRSLIRGRKRPDAVIEAEIRRVISQVDGVTRIPSVTLDHNPLTRQLTMTATVETIYGETAVSQTII